MDATRAVELATEVAEFIEAQRDGHCWRRTDDPEARVDHTLYHGTAGIVLFLLELADATGDAAYETGAVEAGRELADQVAARRRGSVAFATGWPGWAYSLSILHQRTGDERFERVANHAFDQVRATATPIGAGLGWIEPMPFSDITGHSGDREIHDLSVGAAGAALSFLWAAEHGARGDGIEVAAAVAERLLEVGERTADGLRWGLMAEMPFAFTAPNFAHGGAGVGYFMARLFESTGDRRHLDAAISAADYVVSRMHPVGEGALVCHTEEQQPPHFYLGNCHGPAGTGRLFALLARLTGEPRWSGALDTMRRGLGGIGAPEERSWGWWQNHGRCCGDAGLGDAALLVPSLGADLADRCAAVIEGASVATGAGRSWLQAEHRARPRLLERQTGYMQGAAGLGSFLVHLAAPATRIALPDDVV